MTTPRIAEPGTGISIAPARLTGVGTIGRSACEGGLDASRSPFVSAGSGVLRKRADGRPEVGFSGVLYRAAVRAEWLADALGVSSSVVTVATDMFPASVQSVVVLRSAALCHSPDDSSSVDKAPEEE
jgi:hypothetical protein